MKSELKKFLSSGSGERLTIDGASDRARAVSGAEPPSLAKLPAGGLTTAAALDASRAELTAEVGHLRQSVDQLQQALERRDIDIWDQDKTIASLRSEVQQHDRDLERTKNRYVQAVEELDAVRDELQVNKALVENRTHYVNLLLSSSSWRVTAPLRKTINAAKHLRRGAWSWITFKPGSRPHRTAMRFGMVQSVSQPILPAPRAELLVWDQAAQAPRLSPPTIYLFVDHTVDCEVNTGVQRTVRGLASGLLDSNQRVRFVKWDVSLNACVLIDATDRAHLARWNGPAVGPQDRTTYLPGDASPVVQYPQPGDWVIVPEATCITNQSMGITLDLIRWTREARSRIGFVFYDAIPLRRPELASSVPAQKTYMHALQYADAIWSISAWSAADLMAFWSAENVASHPPIYALPLPGAFAGDRTESGPTENLILSVGTIEPRKNQVALVRAFQAHRADNPDSTWQLVLVGNLHPLVAAEIDAATKADSAIKYAGHASEDELASLFSRCAFTVFPSIEEGFGLPILESLWHGKPCLCADFGSMAEVASGGGSLTCDTRDAAQLSDALNRLIAEPDLRAQLAQQARQRQMANWSDYADSILRTVWPLGQIYFLAQATAEWERNTGIQRVVRQLARALLDLGLDVIPVKLSGDGRSLDPMTDAELNRLAAFNGPARNQWRGWLPPAKSAANSWFIMPELPLHLAPDTHDALIANLRQANVKSAAVFYDAIPWKMTSVYPEQYGQAHARYMHALATYDVVAPISHYTEKDLMTFLKSSNAAPYHAKIDAVVLPGEFSESRRATQASLPSQEGPIKILSVGTIEPRKNHETLLTAFVQAAEQSKRQLHLTLVGSSVSIDPSVPERVRAVIANHPSIVWEEHADDTRLKELHQTCDFTVYPSVEEGFGLPILESLWYGKPVICADFGAMGEIVPGGGCVAVNVRDAGVLADAIARLANDTTRIEELSREAVTRVFRSWTDYASDIVQRLRPIDRPTVAEPADRARRIADLGLDKAAPPPLGVCTKVPVYFLIESTSIYDQNTGIQRVVRQLARRLIDKNFALIPVRWDPVKRSLASISEHGLNNLANFNGPQVQDWADWREPGQMSGGWFLLPEVQQHWWTSDHVRLIEQMKANHIRMAAIFYDAIPVKMPNLYPDWLVNAHYRYMIELGFYDRVFPISQFCANDLMTFLKERQFGDKDLNRLIKPAVLPGEFPSSERVTKIHAVDTSPPLRLLTVGTIEPRKNHETFVRAFLLASERCKCPLELTLIGNTNAVDPQLAARIRQMIAGRDNVRWLEKVDDLQLAQWNDWSDLMVYPSIEEGFGLPIIESLWHGKPVLCANFGAMAEAAKAGGCLTVDVRDTEAFADAICRLAENPQLLAGLARDAVIRPIKSWDDYADEIVGWLLDDRSGEGQVAATRSDQLAT